jgi:hypothetical protein
MSSTRTAGRPNLAQQQMGFLHPRDFQLDVQLSKHPYDRHDSDGFMPRTEIVGFFALVPPGI